MEATAMTAILVKVDWSADQVAEQFAHQTGVYISPSVLSDAQSSVAVCFGKEKTKKSSAGSEAGTKCRRKCINVHVRIFWD